MRIISVRQPWAWAIIHGGKDVENRGQNLAGSYRGLVAIHAGKTFDNCAADTSPFTQTWHEQWPTKHPATCDPRIVPTGVIIGVVDLVDVHPGWIEGSPCTPWGIRYVEHIGQNHLVLESPRALATPIPFTGALGLRELDAATEAAIWEQVSR